MLMRKIRLGKLLLALSIASFFIVSIFIYIDITLKSNLDEIRLPVKGIKQNPPELLRIIEGEKKNEFLNSPMAVATSKDKVYVTDSKNNRINVYGKKGKYLFSFGEYGTMDSQFIYPTSIAIDDEDRVYVGEFQNQRIQVFNSKGKHLKTFTGNDNNVLLPLSMAIFKDKIFVANRSSEILLLDLEGKLLKKFGKPGISDDSLNFPNGIAVSKNGKVFVSDSGNSRVKIFSTEGEFSGFLDDSEYRLSLPRGLALDDLGNLYVVDTFGHSVSVFDEDLKFLYSFGNRGVGKGELNFPNGIYIDDEFRIYITDRENSRVSVHAYQ